MTLRFTITRRGVSLTELLLVLSSCTLILSTSGVLLHRVMRIETDSRAFIDAEHACTRLGHQFRSDVHQAKAAELNGAKLKRGLFLQLQLPNNQSIEYGREPGLVRRTARQANKVTSRDEFIIPVHATLKVKQLQSPDRILLSIAPPSIEVSSDADRKLQSYRALPTGVQIEAALHRSTSNPARAKREQSQ